MSYKDNGESLIMSLRKTNNETANLNTLMVNVE